MNFCLGRFSLKRRVVRYQRPTYWCSDVIGSLASFQREFWQLRQIRPKPHRISVLSSHRTLHPHAKVSQLLTDCSVCSFNPGSVASLQRASGQATMPRRSDRSSSELSPGRLVHADETHVTIKGKRAYVWVFTNMHEVAYVYSETREGELLHATLDRFQGRSGVGFLRSLRFARLPSAEVPDPSDARSERRMLDHPYDEELKHIVTRFRPARKDASLKTLIGMA